MDRLVELGSVINDTKAICRGVNRDGLKSNQCTSFWIWLKVRPDQSQPFDPAPAG
jgi:hypothetical protein